mmetsp:Transcript_110006/g.206196  ORF Transcript_110006/g.206196 Transcript_110006/m.206196 type:complete len:535 (-) Transcript_110006:234-1838(-)
MADSWEDLDIDDLEKMVDAKFGEKSNHEKGGRTAANLWYPDESDAIASETVLTSWNVAYTYHSGRVDSSNLPALPSLGELAVDPNGVPAQAVLASSFYPFNPSFLCHFPRGIPLFVCVQGENKAVKRFFGLEVQDMQFDKEGFVHTGTSELCTKCMPEDNPRKCPTELFVKTCKCPSPELNNVQWIFPQLQGNDIMHSKLMLLRFPGCVRLVVSSLNLSVRQWSNAGDSFWWADLPLKPEPCFDEEPLVQQPLLDTLRRWGLKDSWLVLLPFCDWSSLQKCKSHVQMVTSVPGGVSDRIQYGMERLHQCLKFLPKFPPSTECPVDVQVWSLGGATDSWYSDLARTLTQEKFSNLGLLADWKSDHVRFIFQEKGGGTNWREYQEKLCEEDNFLRFVFGQDERRTPSTEIKKVMWDEIDNLLLKPQKGIPISPWGWHSKVMTRTYPVGFCKKPGCKQVHGWRYIGSHNCSRASWGWSYFDRSSKTIVMDPPRNWEMGVILTSLPALSPDEECGVDLSAVAPLPFQPEKLMRTFPYR